MTFLEVEYLSKSYGQVSAVKDFSFEVNKGEIYALVGPDGAGKTTVIRTLCNLLTPDYGNVTIGGLNVSTQFNRIKPLLGYMPQIFSLYPDLSVRENLKFYAGIYGVTGAAYEAKAEYLYKFSNLKPFADRRAQALSGGMKQKLALSCALMHDPELLILDEPTTGVDPLSRRQFWEILLELKHQGVTIIVSTPYMDEVARADRACFVFDGKKLAEGTPQSLPDRFDGQLFYLDLSASGELVRRIEQIGNLKARRFGAGLHLMIPGNERLQDFASRLGELGLDPARLKPIKASLEDYFIQLMETPS